MGENRAAVFVAVFSRFAIYANVVRPANDFAACGVAPNENVQLLFRGETVMAQELDENISISVFRDALRLADERIQRIVTALLLLSAVVVIAEWNTSSAGWLARRHDAVRRLVAAITPLPEDIANAQARLLSGGRIESRAEARVLLAQLSDEVAKSRIVSIPLLGASVDVNDLGTIAGLVATGLMLLLVLALLQVFEVQFLALQKVRAVHARDCRSDPDSQANALYNELLTAQVLWSPPSLARCDRSTIKHSIVEATILFPVIVVGWLLLRSFQTSAVTRTYGAGGVLVPQVVVFFVLTLFGITALLYYRVCRYRWSAAFFFINQQLSMVKPSSGLSWFTKRPSQLVRRLGIQMIARLQPEATSQYETVTVESTIELDQNIITDREIFVLSTRLELLALKAATVKLSNPRLISAEVLRSTLHKNIWGVRAEFGVARR